MLKKSHDKPTVVYVWWEKLLVHSFNVECWNVNMVTNDYHGISTSNSLALLFTEDKLCLHEGSKDGLSDNLSQKMFFSAEVGATSELTASTK